MELSWTGESKALSSGNSWAVNCEKGELGNKMMIEVDVTKFRVQPFRSYKVCISLEDSPTDSHLDEVCTHLFSFEKYVPYVPDDEEDEKLKENITEKHHKMNGELMEANHFYKIPALDLGVTMNEHENMNDRNLRDKKIELENLNTVASDEYRATIFEEKDNTRHELGHTFDKSSSASCLASFINLISFLSLYKL